MLAHRLLMIFNSFLISGIYPVLMDCCNRISSDMKQSMACRGPYQAIQGDLLVQGSDFGRETEGKRGEDTDAGRGQIQNTVRKRSHDDWLRPRFSQTSI